MSNERSSMNLARAGCGEIVAEDSILTRATEMAREKVRIRGEIKASEKFDFLL